MVEYRHDSQDRITQEIYDDGTTVVNAYDCCNILSSKGRDGSLTSYDYDDNRLETTTVNGISTRNEHDNNGNVHKVFRGAYEGANFIETLVAMYKHDPDTDELLSSEDAEGNLTVTESTADEDGNVTTVTTYPNSTTTTTVTARDGRLIETIDQAGIKTTYDYGFVFDTDLGYEAAYQSMTRNGTTATTITDFLGNTVKSTSRAGRVTRQYFNNLGELTKTLNYNGSVQLFAYDRANNISVSALDVNANGIIDYGTDVVNRTEADYFIDQNDAVWQRQRLWSKPASFDTPGAPEATRLTSSMV